MKVKIFQGFVGIGKHQSFKNIIIKF